MTGFFRGPSLPVHVLILAAIVAIVVGGGNGMGFGWRSTVTVTVTVVGLYALSWLAVQLRAQRERPGSGRKHRS